MSNQITANENLPVSQGQIVNNLVLHGDLSRLTPGQKVQYYNAICERIGLDPLTQPFKLLRLSGKEIMYLDRSGAQQLNKLYDVSHRITAREIIQDCYLVTAQAFLPSGRQTESIGAVSLIYPEIKKDNGRYAPHPKANQSMTGDDLCNAMMKAETKAKRRSTLDLLGLGMLDESEVETIPNAEIINPAPVMNHPDPHIQSEPAPVKVSPKTRKAILSVIKSHVFSDDERKKTTDFFEKNPTEEKACRFLESLRNHEKERKKAEPQFTDAALYKIGIKDEWETHQRTGNNQFICLENGCRPETPCRKCDLINFFPIHASQRWIDISNATEAEKEILLDGHGLTKCRDCNNVWVQGLSKGPIAGQGNGVKVIPWRIIRGKGFGVAPEFQCPLCEAKEAVAHSQQTD